MKGILVKSLALVIILSGALAAQGLDTLRIFDQEYTRYYGSSLFVSHPLVRDFNGGGARARGMGNAFLGVSDDASAVSWNPAGLYRYDNQYTQPVVSLSYQSISNDVVFKSQPYIDHPPARFDVNDVANGVNFMSIVVPGRIKGHMFVGSLAYYRLGDEFQSSGMAFETVYYFTNQDILDRITRPYAYSNQTSYRSWANAINLGFGTRLYDKLSFGMVINIMSGGSAQHMREVMTWEGRLIPGLQGNQRGLVVQNRDWYDSTSYSGVNFTFGLKYTTERLSAGLVLKTPFALKQSTDELYDISSYSNGKEMGEVARREHFDDHVEELDQPMILGLGLGYKATPSWLLAFDVEYRPYSGGKINRRDELELVPGGTNIEYFTEFDPLWNDVWSIRAGTEYVWETGGRLFPAIPLRVGLGWVQLPEPIIGVELQGGDVVLTTSSASITKYSFGTGVRWAQIDLDLAYEKSSGDFSNNLLYQQASTDNGSFSLMFTGYF